MGSRVKKGDAAAVSNRARQMGANESNMSEALYRMRKGAKQKNGRVGRMKRGRRK